MQLESKSSQSPKLDPRSSAMLLAARNVLSLQKPEGDWEAEMVWNTMLLAQYIIVHRIVAGTLPFSDEVRAEMVKHFRYWQRSDGGWGMHPESPSYVYFTTMAYVGLRLLEVPADEPMVVKARRFLRAQEGGVLAIPSWGKFWLAMLDLYGWDGVNPIPPEVFLLPESVPLHPNNYYCHTRYIYLGIAFLYGKRFTVDLGPLGDALRHELYGEQGRDREAYDTIRFAKARHLIAKSDLYVRPSAPLRFVYDLLAQYERFAVPTVRKHALAVCLDRIVYEMHASRYQGISPVNGLLNCLALYATSPTHPELAPSLAGMEAWKWQDEVEGIRYAGARSNAWDTAFAMQALSEICESPGAASPEAIDGLRRGYAYLLSTQMQEELPGWQAERRERILGGWCFSDGAHRWAVSDCTAEALLALLECNANPLLAPAENLQISDERILQAVDFMLRRQNADGGFGTYERRRGGPLLELINPSEMYGECMTELSYIECTASCVTALCKVQKTHPQLLPHQVSDAIDRGVGFLRKQQRDDGSYRGFWGVNFTYAAFHIAEALTAAGVERDDPSLRRLVDWLIGKQKPDGSYGERYESCLDGKYREHAHGQAVMTAWALLALMRLLPVQHPVIERGVDWLVRRQLPSGSFPQEAVAGVFFGTAMLDYRYYKEYFPAWALGRYAALRASATT